MKRASFLVAMLVLASGGSRAERLDASACDGLRGEQARLVSAGARRDMERGPEWARANLGRDRLDQIAKLMSVDEQLIFRCTVLQPHPAAVEASGPVPAKSKTKHAKAADGDTPSEGKPKKKAPAAALKSSQSDDAPKPAKKKTKPATNGAEATPAPSKGAGVAQP